VDKILLQRKINKIHKLAAESYRYICFNTPHIFLERTAFQVLTGNGKQIRGIWIRNRIPVGGLNQLSDLCLLVSFPAKYLQVVLVVIPEKQYKRSRRVGI